MYGTVIEEYKNLIARKLFLELEIKQLPVGYISKKTINKKVRYYLQYRNGNKIISTYINNNDVDAIAKKIEKRKKYFAELSVIEERLDQLEKATMLINKNLYCQLSLYRLSYKMDNIEESQKYICSSFADAMNAIEGVGVSSETHNDIEKWKRGEKSFLNVFEDTLQRYGFPVEVVS